MGSPLGGPGGTSLLSRIARGYVVEGLSVSNKSSNAILDALKSYYGTGTNAASVGRTASAVSTGIGYAVEAGAGVNRVGWTG